jgi:Flp pilus assembly protein TadG
MRTLRNDSGASALEFALVFPVILMLTLGIVQIACLIWIDNLLHYSVDVAARCYVVHKTTAPCDTSSNAWQMAQDIFTESAGTFTSVFGKPPTFVSNQFCSGGTGVSVSYTATAIWFFPFPLPEKNPVTTMTARSCYPNVTIPS